MSDKGTNSPHLVVNTSGLNLAFYIGVSIVGLWLLMLYLGGQVNP